MNKARENFYDIVGACAAALAEGEYWVIEHSDGPLPETASKNVTVPVLIVCQALDADWDDLQDQGFKLSRGIFDYSSTADAIIAERGAS